MVDIQKIIDEKIIIHCETLEDAIIFLREADEFGLKWRNGNSYIEDNEWNSHREQTCYFLSQGSYCDLQYYLKHSSKYNTPIKFSNFKEKDLDDYLDGFEDIKLDREM